ncbi:MAG: hypothetical protein H7Y20_17620 [Bryobacteraceae bacterium]|nr:hypothetical protein [Bryobacteraceae bacterium]
MIIRSTVPWSVYQAFRAYLEIEHTEETQTAWPVWAIAADRISQGPSGALLIGWQFISREFFPSTALEKSARGDYGIQRADGTLAGKVQTAELAIRCLAESVESEEPFELRALRIPSRFFEALWLHSLSGKVDVIVPYMSFSDELQEFQKYSLDFLLGVVAKSRRGSESPAL